MSSVAENVLASADQPHELSAGALPPAVREPLLQRSDWLSFGITAVVMFVVYLRTLAPDVTLEYSGILATAANYGGVPHPPGYPLWTLYAWLFARWLPFANVAWRVAVSSAFAAALTCGMIALVVSVTGSAVFKAAGLRSHSPQVERAVRAFAGAVAGAMFGLSGSVWAQAVVAECSPLGLLLLSLVVYQFAIWSQAPERRRVLYGAWFVFGLAFATNQSLAAAVIGLELMILFVEPALGRDFLFASALAVLAGLMIHCLSPAWNSAGRLTGLRWMGFEPIWRGALFAGAVAVVAAAVGIWRTRGLLGQWKTVLGSVTALALGLSIYLYAPIASMTNPPMNWAYPRTVEGFFHLITRGQDQRCEPVNDIGRFSDEFAHYGLAAVKDFGVAACLLALVAVCCLWRLRSQERGWLAGLLALFLCLSLFLLGMINPSVDRLSMDVVKPYFALSFVVLAVWMGYGVALLGGWITGKQESRAF
jgi:Protein of unknown function (DUF2723)